MTDSLQIPGLINAQNPAPGYITGGQPSAAQLSHAAAAGLKRVINLRPVTEDAGYDEAAQAQALGLEYHVIPIGGAPDLNRETAARLDALLSVEPAPATLVHCASGNRVGALVALRAAWLKGQSIDAALATGREWGLKRMEPIVRGLLG